MKHIFYFVLFAFISINIYSQNIHTNGATLTLLDGKSIKLDSYFYDYDKNYIGYSYQKNNGKLKESYRYFEEIYSIKTNYGKDSIIYSPFGTDAFSVEEMGKVVLGSQSAVNEYKPWWALATGFVVGGASMFIPNVYGKAIVPVAYVSGMYFAKPSKTNININALNDSDAELFITGYQSAGRKKILRNTLFGTIGGIIVSGLIYGGISLAN